MTKESPEDLRRWVDEIVEALGSSFTDESLWLQVFQRVPGKEAQVHLHSRIVDELLKRNFAQCRLPGSYVEIFIAHTEPDLCDCVFTSWEAADIMLYHIGCSDYGVDGFVRSSGIDEMYLETRCGICGAVIVGEYEQIFSDVEASSAFFEEDKILIAGYFFHGNKLVRKAAQYALSRLESR